MPMAVLRATLFRTLCVTTGDDQPLDLGSPTSRSLAAYLLLHRSQPTNRRKLAFLFWPRASESAARRNLRQYLHHIRVALETVESDAPLLLTNGSTVQFNSQVPLWLDVEEFKHGLQPTAGLPELKAAIALYAGDLLEDDYEDWCDEERRTLRQMYLTALERISQALQAVGNYNEALAYAHKWTGAEPLDEAAHRCVMTLYALSGDRNRAIQHYRALVETMHQDLEADPLPETQALFQAIQSGALQADRLYAPPIAQPATLTSTPHAILSPPLLPLIGRQPALAQLEDALQSARQGKGCFVLVTGESGIGKTRLIQEYIRQHPDLPALRAVCHELEWLAPYSTLRQALQPAVNLMPEMTWQPPPTWINPLVPLIPTLAQRFPYLAGSTTIPDDNLHVVDSLGKLILYLTDQAAPQPLHLILDDLHWSDSPSWEFLAQLARLASTASLLVIGLCRLEELPAERPQLIRTLERHDLVLHLPLERLTPAETSALAGHMLSELSPDSLFLQRLHRETEGNPFFVIEMVRAIREYGRLPHLPMDWDGSLRQTAASLPQSIQRVIEARLDRLSPPSRELLATAAATGGAFHLSLLEGISQTPAEEIIRYIEEWLQRGLGREDAAGYEFSHDKIRQVAYNSLSRARREYVHRRIGDGLMDAIPPVEAVTLAYHYARSDQPLKALPYLIQAGEQALRARSYHEARQFGLQAVNLLGRAPSSPLQSHQATSVMRIELNLQLAQAYAFTGNLVRAQEILGETEHLAATAGNDARQGNVLYRSSQIFWLRGQPTVAGDYARRTLRVAEELKDSRLLHAALRMLGRVGIALSAFDDAIAYLVRYTNLDARRQDLPTVLGYLGVAYARIGSWARALDAAQRGLALAEAHGASQTIDFARMQLGSIYADHRDWQACLDVIRPTSDPLAQEGAITPLGFMLLGVRGRALGHLGQPQQAIEIIRPGIVWAERTNYQVFHYLPRLFLAECLFLAGNIDAARIEAKRALEQASTAGNRWATAVILRLLAEILTRQPDPDWPQIEDYLIETMQLLRQTRARPDLARTYLALRRLYDRAGQIAWAVDCHFRATSIFEELGMAEELRQAQGQAAHERRGAVVIPGLHLRGPNVSTA